MPTLSDPRWFSTFYKDHLRERVSILLTTYLFSDPPPYTLVEGSTERDISVWGREINEGSRLRGAWMTSLAATREESSLMERFEDVSQEYINAGATKLMFAGCVSSINMGVWLELPGNIVQQHAPHWTPATHTGEKHILYIHESSAASMLPRQAHAQCAAQVPIEAMMFPGNPAQCGMIVSTYAQERFAERIESTQVWAVKFSNRLHEVLYVTALLETLGAQEQLTTQDALRWFSWLEDLSAMTALRSQLEESSMPMRSVASFETALTRSGKNKCDINQFRDSMEVVGLGIRTLFAKAAVAQAGWSDAHPPIPYMRMVASRNSYGSPQPWYTQMRHVLRTQQSSAQNLRDLVSVCACATVR